MGITSIIELKTALRSQYLRRRSSDLHVNNSREVILREIKRDLKRSKHPLTEDQRDAIAHDLIDDIFGFGPLQGSWTILK